MIINTHGHIEHKNCSSEVSHEFLVNSISKTMGIPKEKIYENVLPQIWACDAEMHVKAMDEAGIDRALIMTVDMGMNEDVGEANWTIEEKNQWVVKQAAEYPDKLYTLCAVDPRRGEKAIKLAKKAGLLVYASFMIGNPGETSEDIKMTKHFIQNNPLDSFYVSISAPYPGTAWSFQSHDNCTIHPPHQFYRKRQPDHH